MVKGEYYALIMAVVFNIGFVFRFPALFSYFNRILPPLVTCHDGVRSLHFLLLSFLHLPF
jgi:hypothetical protein